MNDLTFNIPQTTIDNTLDKEYDDFDKQLEKEIETQCTFTKYNSSSSGSNPQISDDELLNKSKSDIILYKNAQIQNLQNIILTIEHDKDELIDNYKNTINKLLERIKDLESKSIGTRPQTATIAKRITSSSSSSSKQKCANCGNVFPENEFLSHSLQCLRKTFHCKRCGALVDESKKKEHLDLYRAPQKIMNAIKENDINMFKLGIEHGFKITRELDKKKNTALHLICMYNRIELMRCLWSYYNGGYGEVLSKENEEGKNPLILAVVNKGVECVKLLLRKGADVKMKDKTSNTALHIACQQGNIEMVEELMKYNPDLKVKNNLGYTPLKMAQVNYHEDLVLLLLSKYNAKLG